MKYALFLGCTAPVRAQNYEVSTRKTAKLLGIELVDIPEFNCCGFPIKSVNQHGALLLSAKNLALAEKEGLNIATICSACTGTLTEANRELKENEELRKEINLILKEKFGLEYNGTIEVKHYARILYEEIGIENIKKMVKNEIKLRLAAHPGCHYVKPKEAFGNFDDPENPKSYNALIEAIGAESIPYKNKMECCGGAILGINMDIAMRIAKDKLEHVKQSKADAMVVVCPFCDVMYEQNQKKIEKDYEVELKIPVVYYPQLLGLALGIPVDELGFKIQRVSFKPLLKKMGFIDA